MVDIESKSLSLIKDYISDLESLLQNHSFLNDKFSEISYIFNWTANDRTRKYFEIMNLIFNNHNINEIFIALCSVDSLKEKELNPDVCLFYSVVSEFSLFFNSVYELYLLDQLYYILKSVSLEDIDKVIDYPSGFTTDSYYEKINFGFCFHQESLLNNEYDKYDVDIFQIKDEYRKRIINLLSHEIYQDKRLKLIEVLMNCFNNTNPYYDKLVILVESLKPKQNYSRRTLKKEPEGQIKLY